MAGNAFIQALIKYFPHGLPADDAQAREMVRQAIVHLLTAPIEAKQSDCAAVTAMAPQAEL